MAIGDSLTEGLADRTPDGPRGWADVLAQHLADIQHTPVQYANLAIRGRLLEPILSEQVDPALELKPDLVSIWAGGNDMLRPSAHPPTMAAHLEEAIAKFRAIGADVLVGTSTDSKGAPLLELNRSRCMEYNLLIWAAARRQGAQVLDTFSFRAIQDWRMWDEDRIHLNTAGHERIAQLALSALGLPTTMPDWDRPLPPAPPQSQRDRIESNYTWARDHLKPWLGRRIRRTSSGFGRIAKHPNYVTVTPRTASDLEGAQ